MNPVTIKKEILKYYRELPILLCYNLKIKKKIWYGKISSGYSYQMLINIHVFIYSCLGMAKGKNWWLWKKILWRKLFVLSMYGNDSWNKVCVFKKDREYNFAHNHPRMKYLFCFKGLNMAIQAITPSNIFCLLQR